MGKLTEGLTGGTSGGGGPMKPGDVRIIYARDKSGAITKTFTLIRTDRPYAYDLCDAYNAEMSESARHGGLAWYVSANGELKLKAPEARARPTEPWKPEPGEAEEIRAKIARIRAANPDMTQAEFNRLVDQGRT